MPIITVNLCFSCRSEQKKGLAKAVSANMAASFGQPEETITVRIVEYTQENCYFAVPRSLPSVQVEVICFPGRSPEQKKQFQDKTLTDFSAVLGKQIRLLTIFLEPPKENWISTR